MANPLGKSLQQNVQPLPPELAFPWNAPSEPTSLPLATSLTLAVFFVLVGAVLFRRKTILPKVGQKDAPRRGTATEKQMKSLDALVAEQNFFRAHALTLQDFIRYRTKTGFVSTTSAIHLISSLEFENESLKREFKNQKRREGVGKFRGMIYVSDLKNFRFCERSSYFSSHQYPSQNLVNMKSGARIHERHANSSNRDAARPGNITDFIRKHEPGVVRVEWVPNAPASTLKHPSRPLTGRPDGFVYFADGSRAVIELKTVGKLPKAPRSFDFDQADTYALLASDNPRLRDESFLLYQEHTTHALAFHRRKRHVTEYDVAHAMAKIERGARAIEELKPATSASKCQTCGYRAICATRVAA